MADRGLTAEFRFLASCCRWPHSPDALAEIEAQSAGLNWEQVVALARRHRVEGFVNHALRNTDIKVPVPIADTLSALAQSIAADGLIQTSVAIRLDECLRAAGIDFLFVKGSTLAILAYDNLSLKQARDIDLLVAPDQAQRAAAILKDEGFERSYPPQPLTDEEFALWMTHCKESSWTSAATLVELHTALADNARLLSGLTVASPRQNVPVAPGRTLPTLARDELFAYLCVHGATHGWSRLKWLVDLAAFLRRQPEEAVIAMYRNAQGIGAGRSASQALLLAHQLLALTIPAELRVEIERDPRNRWLTALALRAMVGAGTEELDDQLLGTVGINLSHFLLGRGLRYKVGELGRKLSIAEDRVVVPLPRTLSFLYPVMAVPLWIWRRYRVGRS